MPGDFGMLRHHRDALCADPAASSLLQPLPFTTLPLMERLNVLNVTKLGYKTGIGVPVLSSWSSRFISQGPGVTRQGGRLPTERE